MKNIIKSIFVLGIASLSIVACNVDAVGTHYDLEGKSGVSFPKSIAGDTEVNAKATSFSIPIVRGTADGSLTVSLASTLPEGVKAPSSVTFNAGEFEAEIPLDITEMEVGKTYKGALKLADDTQFDKNTAISEISVTLAKAYTWIDAGKGQLYDGLALQPGESDLGIINVTIMQAEGFDRWRIIEPFPAAQLEKAWGADYMTYAPTQMIEFFSDADGVISFTSLPIKTGLTYVDLGDNAYIYYYLPSKYSSNYAENDADNCFVMDKVAQFCFGASIENTTYGFGLNYLFLSLPGGPDLNELLQ